MVMGESGSGNLECGNVAGRLIKALAETVTVPKKLAESGVAE